MTRRAGDAERERLHETFAALCAIESPSGHERACADWVTAELRECGLDVDEDGAGPIIGADAGNLFTRVAGAAGGAGEGAAGGAGESLFLCAHMDTVPPLAPIEPIRVDGGWTNANEGILGADNKAAVAVLIELARRLVRAPAPTGVELLFTVSEENGLHGAKEFDVSQLRSGFGYVFDHATPIGEIVIAAPTHQRIEAVIRGRAAHAGVRPEEGRSAITAAARAIAVMPLGRLDGDTTSNVGVIAGGTATNVVPERCRIEAEVRGLDDRRVEEVVTELVDALQDAVNVGECDLDVIVTPMFRAYRTNPRAPQIELAERALRTCGYEPRHITTGGGADANAFQTNGFPCTNLADGTEHNHEPSERISDDALEGLFELAIALVDEAGSGAG